MVVMIGAMCATGLAQDAVTDGAATIKSEDPVVSTTVLVKPAQDSKSQDLIHFRPFSKIAVGVTVSTFGVGAEIATPLSRSFNLRAAGNGFNFGYGFNHDGADYYYNLRLRSAQVSLDWFPFHKGFHISPGMLINESNLSGTVNMPAGRSFDLGKATYTSSTTDPAHGSASLSFSRTVMPSVMLGWGNLLPRSGRKFSIPFEFGAAYMGHTAIALNLQGTACQQNVCQSTTTPSVQMNLQTEQNNLNESIKRLQAYPILSTGFSYRF